MIKILLTLCMAVILQSCCRKDNPCKCRNFGETIMFSCFTDEELEGFYYLKYEPETGQRIDSGAVTYVSKKHRDAQWGYNEADTQYNWRFVNKKLGIDVYFSEIHLTTKKEIVECNGCFPKAKYLNCDIKTYLSMHKNGEPISANNPENITNPNVKDCSVWKK